MKAIDVLTRPLRSLERTGRRISGADRSMVASSHPVGHSVATSQRIPVLDGVRGVAIALVLIYHYADVVVSPGSRTLYGSTLLYYAFVPTRLMWSGVDLFFILSGFLIGGILIDHRDSPRYFSTFYARRIYRIFPIYYLLIAVLAFGAWLWPLSPLFTGDMPLWVFPLYAQNLLGDYTKAPDSIEVAWSLAVEEQFYLLFPFIVRYCSRRALLYVLAVCIVGAPLLRIALIADGLDFQQVYPLLPTRVDSLALGVVAAIVVRSEEAKNWIRTNSRGLYLCLVGFCLILPTLLKWNSYWYVGTVGYSILAVTFFLLVVLLLVVPIPFLVAALSARWLRWLGMVSFCVYLVHQPVRIGLFLLFLPGSDLVITGAKSLLVTLASLVVALAIAQASWVFIERPLINRGRRRHNY